MNIKQIVQDFDNGVLITRATLGELIAYASAADKELGEQALKALTWLEALQKCAVVLDLEDDAPMINMHAAIQQRIDDYDEAAADKQRLVRELDVLLNGEAGAAQKASLCDIVAQVRGMAEGVTPPLTNKTFQFRK